MTDAGVAALAVLRDEMHDVANEGGARRIRKWAQQLDAVLHDVQSQPRALAALIQELDVFMRESVTSWPVERVYVCRCCRGSMQGKHDPKHRDSCIVSRLAAVLRGIPQENEQKDQATRVDDSQYATPLATASENKLDPTCEHGVAWDVHCCGCHSGFIFDSRKCVCF